MLSSHKLWPNAVQLACYVHMSSQDTEQRQAYSADLILHPCWLDSSVVVRRRDLHPLATKSVCERRGTSICCSIVAKREFNPKLGRLREVYDACYEGWTGPRGALSRCLPSIR